MYLNIIFIFLALTVGLDLVRQPKNKTNRYIIGYWTIICLFILISSLRWERGTDWDTYYLFYNGFDTITIDGYMEPGFCLFTSINKTIISSYTWHLFLMAIMAIVLVGKTILKYSVFPFMSLLVWYSMSLANIFPVRQTIAIALLIYSTKYIIERKKWCFVAILCLAMSFHYSAIIFGMAYYIFHKKITRSFLIITLLITIVGGIIGGSQISNILYKLGGPLIQSKLEYYMETNSDNNFGSAYSAQEILFRGIINRSFLFFIPLLFLENRRKVDSILNGFFNLYYWGFILFVLFVPLSPALGRIVAYYDYSQFFIVSYIFTIPFNKRSLFFVYLAVCLYCFMRFNGVVQNYKDEYIPYKSIITV